MRKMKTAPVGSSGNTSFQPAVWPPAPVLAGRRTENCAKDPVYRKMESDMHNLQPAVGEVNGDRANFMYGQWNGGEGQYGQCAMKVDFKDKVAEPPARARGSIARTYFYMRDTYQLTLPPANPAFTARDKMYPVTSGVRTRRAHR